MNQDDQEPDVIAESENFGVWRTQEEDGWLYHVELGGVTLHFAPEEWDEFLTLMKSING